VNEPTNHKSKNNSMVDASCRGEKQSASSLKPFIGDGIKGTVSLSGEIACLSSVRKTMKGPIGKLTDLEHGPPPSPQKVTSIAVA
jgi:hypothetical protein